MQGHLRLPCREELARHLCLRIEFLLLVSIHPRPTPMAFLLLRSRSVKIKCLRWRHLTRLKSPSGQKQKFPTPAEGTVPSRTAASRASRRPQPAAECGIASPRDDEYRMAKSSQTSPGARHSKRSLPASPVEHRRAKTDPVQLRSQVAFDASTARPRNRCKPQDGTAVSAEPFPRDSTIGVDQAEDWYRAMIRTSIHIAASPSVFQTSFPPDVLDARPAAGAGPERTTEPSRYAPVEQRRPQSRLAHRGRSPVRVRPGRRPLGEAAAVVALRVAGNGLPT